MRIEAYTQVQQLYKVGKPGKASSAKNAGFSDKVQISSLGKDIQTAKTAVANTGDIREDMIAPLKAKVQSGEYHVNPSDFAEKLLQKYEELR